MQGSQNVQPKRRGNGHPLESHEADLQAFVRLSLEGKKHSVEMFEIESRLSPQFRGIAGAIFRNARVVSTHCDPDDAVQHFWERWNAIGAVRYGHYRPLFPVIYKMLCHGCITMVRSSRQGHLRVPDFELADPRDDGRRDIESGEILDSCLARLDPKRRMAVERRHKEGLSAKEAGKIAGATPGQITRWAYEGRTQIREDLRRQGLHRRNF